MDGPSLFLLADIYFKMAAKIDSFRIDTMAFICTRIYGKSNKSMYKQLTVNIYIFMCPSLAVITLLICPGTCLSTFSKCFKMSDLENCQNQLRPLFGVAIKEFLCAKANTFLLE